MKPESKFIFYYYHKDHPEFYTWSLRRLHTEATSLINVYEKLNLCPSFLVAFVFALKSFRDFALFQRHTVFLMLVSYTVGTLRNLNVTHTIPLFLNLKLTAIHGLPNFAVFEYCHFVKNLRTGRVTVLPPHCCQQHHCLMQQYETSTLFSDTQVTKNQPFTTLHPNYVRRTPL